MEKDRDIIEFFISEIEKYPEIWNISSEEYKDKDKKRIAWERICEIFCDGYHNRSEDEKQEICNKYKTRWKNLRDAFIRQARKRSQLDSSSSKISKEYLYSRQLSFLKNDKTISDIKLLIDNVPNVSIKKPKLEIDTDNISTKSYEIQPSLSFTSSSIRKNPSSSNKKKSSSSIHKTNYHNELDEPIIDNFLNVSLPSYSTEIDEDKSFFHSLMPMVKLFNIDQKLEFRCEVLNLIKKIRASTVIKTNVSNNKPSTSKQDSIQSHYKISLNNDQSLSTSFKNDPLQNSFQNINEDSDEFSI